MTVCERFLHYVSFDTQSDEQSETCPSTKKQLLLAEYLKEELTFLGAEDVSLSETGYVYATIPASKGAEEKPVLAFLAHMDTSPECPGKEIRARIIPDYDGEDILLNAEKGISTTVKEFPGIRTLKGQKIIVTDGTTLLGSDDKAGIAIAVSAAEKWLHDSGDETLRHPEIRLIFTPDEEIGRGVSKIDLKKVGAACGYTIDGGSINELSYECFHAASAEVTLSGVSVHPGSAFGIMKNASLLAMEYAAMLPPLEVPAATRDRMGFYHLTEMEGNIEKAVLHYILRDHDRENLKKREETVLSAGDFLNQKYGQGTCTVCVTESYANMIEKILPDHAYVIENAREALRELGITPDESPIRGGTDGAMLSYMGLPCPNLGTGGLYFHGPHELVSVDGMETMIRVLGAIAKRMA